MQMQNKLPNNNKTNVCAYFHISAPYENINFSDNTSSVSSDYYNGLLATTMTLVTTTARTTPTIAKWMCNAPLQPTQSGHAYVFTDGQLPMGHVAHWR